MVLFFNGFPVAGRFWGRDSSPALKGSGDTSVPNDHRAGLIMSVLNTTGVLSALEICREVGRLWIVVRGVRVRRVSSRD